jgi:AcrR family transcriptional regulator
MSGSDFDQALIAAAFERAAEVGWTRLTVVDAARAAGLSLAEARVRFPGKLALLRRFGAMMDQAALAAAPSDGPPRDRLFDLIMSRFDAMKPHRSAAGIAAALARRPGGGFGAWLRHKAKHAVDATGGWYIHHRVPRRTAGARNGGGVAVGFTGVRTGFDRGPRANDGRLGHRAATRACRSGMVGR